MKTNSAKQTAEFLRRGRVALVPTETVVGLVAAESGLHRLHEIKSREPEKPIALLCATPEQAFALTEKAPPLARRLADLLWPGPLTLVLDGPRGGTVGLRVPDHPVVQALLAEFGEPLYATSANVSGEPPPTSLEDVDARVREAVNLVLEGEPGDGRASAVVDLSGGRVRLLRSGADLTEARLRSLAEDRI